MGLFGSAKRKRPFGSIMGPTFGAPGAGIVATPEQEAETRRMEAQFGIQPSADEHWGSPADQPEINAPTQGQAKQPGFWQGGGKFGVRDGIAGILAAVGDGLSRQGGMEGGAVGMLTGGRMSALEQARKAQEAAQQQRQTTQALIAAGIDPAKANLGGMGIAKYSDLKPADAPAAVQTSQWYKGASPADRAAYDATNPIITHGYGSALIPRASLQQPSALPQGYDPNEWEPAEAPQPQSQPSAPTLTPEQWQGAVQSLGPQKAEEWRRRNGYQIGGR